MFERRHRHFVETVLTLLINAHMPFSYWTYTFQTATYVINRMPTSTLNNQSPFEKLFKQLPNYLKLKQFGCPCYPLTRPYNKHKLEPKAKPCTFMGYSFSQKAYLCLEPNTRKIFHSRYVIFHEGPFPFQTSTSTNFMLFSPSLAIKDSSILISLLQVALPPLHPTGSLELGVVASQSSVNGSSPTSLPRQVSTPCSPTLLLSQIPPLEVHAPATSEHTEVCIHRMTTRSMNDIYKPKQSFVVTKHPLPPTLEPTSASKASPIPTGALLCPLN